MGIIYCIENLENGKCYIGQTVKNKFNLRYRGGKWWKWTKNSALLSAYTKYGQNSFKVLVLEGNINNIEELNFLELYYSKKFNSVSPNGYNLVECGSSNAFSEESRQKCRNSSIKRGKSIKINCSNGSTYDSIRQAAIDLNISTESIRKVLKGENRHSHNLTFSLYPNIPEKYEKSLIYCTNGKVYTTEAEAAIDLGVGQTAVNAAIGKKQRSVGGHGLSRDKNTLNFNLKIAQGVKRKIICSNGVVYSSSTEASILLNIKQGHISECANNKRRQVNGLTFSFNLSEIPKVKQKGQ